MTPFLPESLLSSGAVGFLLNDSSPVDVVVGAQGYAAGFARGTTTAVAGSDTFWHGARYTATGIIRLVDATAGLPAGAIRRDGIAFSSTGQLCYTTDAPSGTSAFFGGMAVDTSGAVHLSDLSPAAWFRFNQGITITGAGVSTWADKSGNGRDLLQGTDSRRPPKQPDGSILFDGTDDYLKTASFTFNQPESVYLLMRSVTWTAGDYIADGDGANSMLIAQDKAGGSGSSPAVTQYAGAYGGEDQTHMTVGSYHVLCCVFNGASSLVQVDLNTAGTGNAGATNSSGFTLGISGDAFGAASNIQVMEAVLCAAAHTAAQRTSIVKYLARVGGISV